ncbi:BTB/POZ domain/Regulator of chromosome condensation (RCC1) repeat, putative [Angomonas deanei]|uniref:BTB/POZ domain/Regulator of chromosome condensation (RCC1) repeat, putative n=1 Tax=Angomonas deanei TaxID=59799 RepID=A0A7G2CQK5_9TRYP|nr:BTB/POZ domain/Regulator of chromosome condensation (RCC1) repeat, putative [Angomonas deanei]
MNINADNDGEDINVTHETTASTSGVDPPPPSSPHITGEEGLAYPQERAPRPFATSHADPVCRGGGSEWVRLVVGGRPFATTFSTLCDREETVLSAMCAPLRQRRATSGEVSGEGPTIPVDQDAEGSLLLDVDPDHFAPILNYLRHGILSIPPTVSVSGVLAVAHYLNVQGVVRQLSAQHQRRRQLMFSWGSGSCGELGSQQLQHCPRPASVKIAPHGHTVVQVALGANYSMVLTQSGRVYTFGNGDWGQLGLGTIHRQEATPDRPSVVMVPRSVPLFEQLPARSVASGYAFAMAIATHHRVYFWGNNNHGQSGLGPSYFDPQYKKIETPRLVESLEGKEITQLSCGSFFSLALSEGGSVYSWGLVECLGIGSPQEVLERFRGSPSLAESYSSERRPVVLTPQLVVFPEQDSPITHLHAGQWHSGAINRRGQLFTWGVGYQGRLGHRSKDPAYRPTQVKGALEAHRVVGVSCGSFHTAALTEGGLVFCWGDNSNGQCGSRNRAEAVLAPYRVVALEFVAGGVARGVSCGRQHTAVVMEGPQPGCPRGCCDHNGETGASHQQVYVFGEGGITPRALPTDNEEDPDGVAPGPLEGQPIIEKQFQLVPGLLQYNVQKAVSGLHHSFLFAEDLPTTSVEYLRAGEALHPSPSLKDSVYYHFPTNQVVKSQLR